MPLSGVNARDGADVRLGHLLVPVPRLARLGQPVRLAERGHDIDELEPTFTAVERAARVRDGRVMPELERL